MSKFFKYNRTTAAGSEVVYLNLSNVTLASYNEETGNLSIKLEGGENDTLIGDQADALRKVFEALSAK